MEKFLAVILTFFCISINATDSAQGVHSVGARLNRNEFDERLLKDCDDEKFANRQEFINDCFEKGVNPNLFYPENRSALILACEDGKKGSLFLALLVSNGVFDDEESSILFECALKFENYQALKKMASKLLLSPKQLSKLIELPVFFDQRYELLCYFADFLEQYLKQSDSEDFSYFIKLACEIDRTGKKFHQLIKCVKIDSSEFIYELLQICRRHENKEVLKIMTFYGFFSSQELLKIIADHKSINDEHFFLCCFTRHLNYYLKHSNDVIYCEFIKLACKVDKKGVELIKLTRPLKALRKSFIHVLFEICCEHNNLQALRIIASNGLLPAEKLLLLITSENLASERCFFLSCFTDNVYYYRFNGGNPLDFMAFACAFDKTGEEFSKLISHVNYSEANFDKFFQICLDNENREAISRMLNNGLLNGEQISRFRDMPQ